LCGAAHPLHFAIIIPSYNNENICIWNLESCVRQNYPYFTVFYVNDCSTDHTLERVSAYVESQKLEDKCVIINNQVRKGALANVYSVISLLDPHMVVVLVDGDDRLMHNNVLNRLAQVYADKNIWMTYGSFETYPNPGGNINAPIPAAIIANHTLRRAPWVTSHLRTFYAKLFLRIRKKDLLYTTGKFFPTTWDMAIMLPMIEMASPNHFKYMAEKLYLYNWGNPIAVNRVNPALQRRVEQYIRNMPPYAPIPSLF
jgi:glycosyltransferase involved in cell wall biosynthesis